MIKDSVFSLCEGWIILDGNDLSVEVDVNLNGKFNVVVSILVGVLDLKCYLGGEIFGGDVVFVSIGWFIDFIDVSVLGLFDGKIMLFVLLIDFGSLNFGFLCVVIDVDNFCVVVMLY